MARACVVIETQSIPSNPGAGLARELRNIHRATTLPVRHNKATLARPLITKALHAEMSVTLQALKVALPNATSLVKLQMTSKTSHRAFKPRSAPLEQRLRYRPAIAAR